MDVIWYDDEYIDIRTEFSAADVVYATNALLERCYGEEPGLVNEHVRKWGNEEMRKWGNDHSIDLTTSYSFTNNTLILNPSGKKIGIRHMMHCWQSAIWTPCWQAFVSVNSNKKPSYVWVRALWKNDKSALRKSSAIPCWMTWPRRMSPCFRSPFSYNDLHSTLCVWNARRASGQVAVLFPTSSVC